MFSQLSTRMRAATALALVLCSFSAQAITIGLLSPSSSELSTVQSGLAGTGLFTSITTISDTSTLTAADLMSFDAVLTWSNSPYQNPAGVGGALKDYVDAGGGLVAGIYGLSGPWSLQGGIATTGYLPFLIGSPGTDPGSNLVATDPSDPVFSGVNLAGISFFTNSNYINPTLDAGAQLLATNGAGIEMIARNASGNVIAANIFPGFGGTGDFYDLFGNMLTNVAGPTTVPEPSSLALFVLGLGFAGLVRRRRKQ